MPGPTLHSRRAPLAIATALTLCAGGVALADDAAQKGLEIAKKSHTANEGFKGETSVLEMKLVNATGDETLRKMSSQIIDKSDDGDKSLITFSWPADVNGTRMLTWSHRSADDDQWLYLPAIKRTKRITSRNKSGSFMGSEFSYEDLGSQEVEKYTYKFIGDKELDGRKVWVMERYPVDKRSGYKRQIVWQDKEYLNPLKIEYYDRKNELLKVGYFESYKKHGKFWRADKIRMENVQTKKKSVLTWSGRKMNQELDEDEFEKDALSDDF